MQFLLTVTIAQHTGAPSAELQAAMTKFVEDETRSGTFLITGGTAGRMEGARIGSSGNGAARGEPQLPIDGYAVVDCPALDQAVEVASRLLRVHRDLAPEWQVECEVRPIITDCIP